jgi:hypothetical protein
MIKLALPLIFLVSIKGFSREIQFETKFSEPFAVFQFMNSLSSKTADNVYKKMFRRSELNTKKYTDLIARFDSLNLNYSYEFTDYPAGQKVGGDIPDFLRRNLILSDNMQDFKLRSMGLIPNQTLLTLVALIQDFTPLYEAVIYLPAKSKFEDQLKGISDLIRSSNINHYFNEVLQFYNSSWDVSVPMVFAFYPLPESRGFTATAVSNIAISAIADSLDNYQALLSVMLHEVSHILYDERSLSLWIQSEGWFTSNPSRVSRYANSLFNESMATAVGNGYLAAQLNGKEDTVHRWYGVKYINLMAKAAYPLVKEYIVAHKPIDQDFVNRYIKIYGEHFSAWLSDPDYLMIGRTVLSENPADFDLLDQRYAFLPNHEYFHEISETVLKKLKNNHGTKWIIVNKENNERLALIKNDVEELRDWQYNAQKDFVHSIFLKDNTWLIIFNNVQGTTKEKLQGLVIKESE